MLGFLKELTRRKVWLFGGIYLALGWVALQVAIALEGALALPAWVDQLTVVLLALGLPFALLLAWAQESRGKEDQAPVREPQAIKQANPKGPPSIAVLPFDNISDDPDQAYFADGIAEDLITMLSSISRLSVTARNSSFAYKGTSPDIRKVGEELNVNYVVEGSIRRVGERLRVTAQLIETATGSHIWAEKYDRPSTELYDIQDDVIESVCSQVGSAILAKEFDLSKRTRVEDMDAWALFMRAESMSAEQPSEEGCVEREELLQAALELEPDFAMAFASLASVHSILFIFGFVEDNFEKIRLTREAIDRAVSLAPNDPFVLERAAVSSLHIGDLEQAQRFATHGIEVAPSQAILWALRGRSRAFSGDIVGGEEDLERALALGKNNSFNLYMFFYLAYVRFVQSRFDEMEELCKEGLSRYKDEWLLVYLIVALVSQGKIGAAQDTSLQLLERRPDWTVAKIKNANLQTGAPQIFAETVSKCLKQAGME